MNIVRVFSFQNYFVDKLQKLIMVMEQDEYFINIDNVKVIVQLEGRRKQVRRGGGNSFILQSRELCDLINSLWIKKFGFNKCIVQSGRDDQEKGGEKM